MQIVSRRERLPTTSDSDHPSMNLETTARPLCVFIVAVVTQASTSRPGPKRLWKATTEDFIIKPQISGRNDLSYLIMSTNELAIVFIANNHLPAPIEFRSWLLAAWHRTALSLYLCFLSRRAVGSFVRISLHFDVVTLHPLSKKNYPPKAIIERRATVYHL